MKCSKSLLTLGFAIGCAAIALSLTVRAQAQTYTDLANFNVQNGAAPGGPVTQAPDGNFYGVAGIGGASSTGYGGEVFRVTPTGTITPIYRFCQLPNCADGAEPTIAPILGSDGNLYGVTGYGGSANSGIIYKMTLNGKITTLYSFCSYPCNDGTDANGLMLASDGNFYGTTFQGGRFNSGTIFQISSTGNFKVLYSFCSLANCADGVLPQFSPIQGGDGNFYGTALGGGKRQGGVFYELTTGGAYKVLYNFCIYSDQTCSATGSSPSTIVQDAHGNFFGTTSYGGSKGYGTAFEFTSTNHYVVLDSFDYLRGNPIDGLTLANDGNLYGKTYGPGTGQNSGIIFEITPAGRYTQLYTFSQCSPSGYSSFWGPLFQGTDGLFYGTTQSGGNDTNGGCGGDGTVFSLSNGLGLLVETVPVAGKVGQRVIILGNGLTGSTSVTFNGVAAAFTVESDTYIKATVPTGATTGVVSVVTPTGKLNSNPQFVVTK